MEELRERGIIHITTVTDPRVMGYHVIAMVGLRLDPSCGVAEVAAELAALPGAFYVVLVSGRYNVVMELYCADMDALAEIMDSRLKAIPGIVGIEVFPYLRLHYRFPAFDAAWRKRESGAERRSAPLGPSHVDQTDRRIITILHEDGRASLRAIGREIGISESQVRRRVGRLTSSGALRIMALTVPGGVGFHTAAFVAISVDPGESIEATATALAELPAVIYVAICAGEFDIFSEVVCPNQEDLLRVLDRDIRALPGIRRAEPWMHIQLHYRSVQPSDIEFDEASRAGRHDDPVPATHLSEV